MATLQTDAGAAPRDDHALLPARTRVVVSISTEAVVTSDTITPGLTILYHFGPRLWPNRWVAVQGFSASFVFVMAGFILELAVKFLVPLPLYVFRD
jgi:hypothetical protein